MATIGTLLYTWLNGRWMGQDALGNNYYKTTRGALHGRERRWVVYRGRPEASNIPPEWHAWLHHTCGEPLSARASTAEEWQKPHQPNLTGSSQAYRPKGHPLYSVGHRDPADAGGSVQEPAKSPQATYEAWVPDC